MTRPTVFHLRRARDLIDRHFAEPRRVSPGLGGALREAVFRDDSGNLFSLTQRADRTGQ
ncbi:MAG: hypothetical protein ACRDRK_11235 [Pseudonocardia sp.]